MESVLSGRYRRGLFSFGADAGGLYVRRWKRRVGGPKQTCATGSGSLFAQPDPADEAGGGHVGRFEVPMPKLMGVPPYSAVEPVTEMLHGVTVTDPYRWLEDGQSLQTRLWLQAQTDYARSYLDNIPGRAQIRNRVRELLDVDTYDSILKCGNRYIFRKRLPGQEQPCIYLREGAYGVDQLLIDPAPRGTGKYTAVKPLRVSPDERLLLYEVKQGGERAGVFEILDLTTRTMLPDSLPHGYLRSFAFAPDGQSFYYVHERAGSRNSHCRAAYRHLLGTELADDELIFHAGENERLRLHIVPGRDRLGFIVYRLLNKTYTDFYLWSKGGFESPIRVIENADYKFGPLLLEDGRILAITDREAPNLRIVELSGDQGREGTFTDVVPTGEARIEGWAVTKDRIYVSYLRQMQTEIDIFDLGGKHLGRIPTDRDETTRLTSSSMDSSEVFLECESFTRPIRICEFSPREGFLKCWARRETPFDPEDYGYTQVWFSGRDGTRIPMYLGGRRQILQSGPHPTIMTSYGGYGVSMMPQFSVLVAFLMERGCLFALPNIRGGSEFGAEWHNAAKRRKRQVAFDDFLCAAEWLIATGRTEGRKLAIFGGSNSGLLVGAAMTQRPELFRAVLCMVPMLDMVRYHLFDNAHLWKDEFGTADDPDDFAVLAAYSPLHRVKDGNEYPATMIVSGDADQNCNPLHARKMTARLQAANRSEHPIFLDYRPLRGHSPVLPLSERIEGLTDRIAFLCHQLELHA